MLCTVEKKAVGELDPGTKPRITWDGEGQALLSVLELGSDLMLFLAELGELNI